MLTLSDDEYRTLSGERSNNCYDCFYQYEAHLCTTLYDRCQTYDQETDGAVRSKAESDALGLMEGLKDPSLLKESMADSGYCRYFQIVTTDENDFCQLDHGTRANMTANYLAMMAAQAVAEQTESDNVEILMVHIQMDTLGFKQYMKLLMEKLDSDTSGRQVNVDGIVSSIKTNSTLTTIHPLTANGYKMWAVLHPNKPLEKSRRLAVKQAVADAAKKFGKGVYLAKGARVVQHGNRLWVTLMKSKRCQFC